MRQVKVYLHIGNKQLDIGSQGLTSLKFQRYTKDGNRDLTGILTELDMTVFDRDGYDLMGAIQRSGNALFIQYGFEGLLSPLYKITPTRFNLVQNNRGGMIGVGGFGVQYLRTWAAENYKEGVPLRDLIAMFAERNGWNIGTYNEKTKRYSHIDIDGFVKSGGWFREANKTDIEFIRDVVLPHASKTTVFDTSTKTESLYVHYDGFYDFVYHEEGGTPTLYVFKKDGMKLNRRVWEYSYGDTDEGLVIDMTNQINYDWIVNGLTIQVPLFDDIIAMREDVAEETLRNLLNDYTTKIENIFTANDLIPPELTNLSYKFKFYDPGDMEYDDPETIIIKEIERITNTFNTMELTIVGNPEIKATDLIDLKVVNRDGVAMIQNGLWRIIGITEHIGLRGYTTTLTLVKENVVKYNRASRTPSGGGLGPKTMALMEVVDNV